MARGRRAVARARARARLAQAEEELIRVIPNFQHDVLRFVTGNYGPFAPQTAVEVPLWLACLLRKRRMCTVVPPDWLHADKLAEKRDAEAGDEEAFSAMPFRYREVAALLLESADEELVAGCGCASALSIREALEDIAAQRAAKVRAGMLAVATQSEHDATTYSVKMNGVGSMEIAAMRPQLAASLGAFYDARPPAAAPAAKRKQTAAPANNAAPAEKRTLKRFKE